MGLDAGTLSIHVAAINASTDSDVKSANATAFSILMKAAFARAASPSAVQDVFAIANAQRARVMDKGSICSVTHITELFSAEMKRVQEGAPFSVEELGRTLSSHVAAINASTDSDVQSANATAFSALMKAAFARAASPSEVQEVFAIANAQRARVMDKGWTCSVDHIIELFSAAMKRVQEQ